MPLNPHAPITLISIDDAIVTTNDGLDDVQGEIGIRVGMNGS